MTLGIGERVKPRVAPHAGLPALTERIGHGPRAAVVVLGDGDHCFAGAHGPGGHRDAVEHEVRHFAQQRPTFLLAGSPSEPFAATAFDQRHDATARIFAATGNDAPPRPRIPACSNMVMTCSGAQRPRSGSVPCRSR